MALEMSQHVGLDVERLVAVAPRALERRVARVDEEVSLERGRARAHLAAHGTLLAQAGRRVQHGTGARAGAGHPRRLRSLCGSAASGHVARGRTHQARDRGQPHGRRRRGLPPRAARVHQHERGRRAGDVGRDGLGSGRHAARPFRGGWHNAERAGPAYIYDDLTSGPSDRRSAIRAACILLGGHGTDASRAAPIVRGDELFQPPRAFAGGPAAAARRLSGAKEEVIRVRT